jgi:hypothetical protein
MQTTIDEKARSGIGAHERRWWQLEADHHLVDEKGRKVTGYAVIWEFRPEETSRWARESGVPFDGKRFELRIHARRDGQHFAAIHSARFFESVDGALKAARKSLLDQGKRYARKYAGKQDRPRQISTSIGEPNQKV